uniref:Mariner transposase putative n=1 Tax=Albugo laibachii Nc14 TaxID=890382 RepID=F0WFK0_9STRA|nr:mariner transposase putative [Albugo laibachii Nc14]|eukprot:CCA19982.1 mariner transposase putative [Albugo laibachii Nc14]
MTSFAKEKMTMPNLDENARRAIVSEALKRSNDGVLPHGTFASLARIFSVHRQTVERIWHRYQDSVVAGNTAGDISSRIKKNSGRKGFDKAFVEAKVRATPIHKRRKIKSTAIATGFSVGVIQRLLVEKRVQRRSTLINPVLTEVNKLRRVAYALSFLNSDSQRVGEVEGHTFDPMFDMVHVDEKWFNHDTKKRVYYPLSDEESPLRHLHSAKFIEKMMFLAAVARPR